MTLIESERGNLRYIFNFWMYQLRQRKTGYYGLTAEMIIAQLDQTENPVYFYYLHDAYPERIEPPELTAEPDFFYQSYVMRYSGFDEHLVGSIERETQDTPIAIVGKPLDSISRSLTNPIF